MYRLQAELGEWFKFTTWVITQGRNFTPKSGGDRGQGHITGVWGLGPGADPLVGGQGARPPEAERFWQNNVKIWWATLPTKNKCDRLFEVWEGLNPIHWMAISHFSNRRRFFETSHKHKAVNLARKLCCCNLATWLFANSFPHKPMQACPSLVSYSNKWTPQY